MSEITCFSLFSCFIQRVKKKKEHFRNMMMGVTLYVKVVQPRKYSCIHACHHHHQTVFSLSEEVLSSVFISIIFWSEQNIKRKSGYSMSVKYKYVYYIFIKWLFRGLCLVSWVWLLYYQVFIVETDVCDNI